MRHKRTNLPLTLITALLVLLIAGLAGSTLVVLRRMHRRSAHTAAAETVISQGQAMVARLSSQPSVTSTNANASDWSEFSRLVRNLYTLEDGLQYVSVVRDGVVVFHEQTRLLDGSEPPTPVPRHPRRWKCAVSCLKLAESPYLLWSLEQPWTAPMASIPEST